MKTIVVVILVMLFLLSGCCNDQLTNADLLLKYKEDGYFQLLFYAGLGCSEDKKGEDYEEIRIELLESKLKQWCEINNCSPSDYEILNRQIILPSWSNDSIFSRPRVVYDIRVKMKE